MTIIQITDGTTTLDLYDDDSYMVIDQSWRPAVGRRDNGAAGMPYPPVLESMDLMITGSSVADCLAKLAALTTLIDQADRWRQGEDVAAVVFKYQPGGSALANPLQWTVYGGPDSGPAVAVPPRVEWIANNEYKLTPVGLQFKRLGAGLGDEENVYGSDSSTLKSSLQLTVPFASSVDIHSPYRFTYYLHFAANQSQLEGMFFLAGNGDNIHNQEAESVDSRVTYNDGSNVSESTASGGSIRRFTASAAIQKAGYMWTGGLWDKRENMLRCGVYAHVRNNGSTWWKIRAVSRPQNTLVYPAAEHSSTGWQVVDGSINDPQLIYLGSLSTHNAFSSGHIYFIELESEASASDTLDIDSLFFVSNNAYAIKVDRLLGETSNDSATIIMSHLPLEYTSPFIRSYNGVYQGNLAFYFTGSEATAIFVATNKSTFTLALDSAGMTAYRRPAYLTPR